MPKPKNAIRKIQDLRDQIAQLTGENPKHPEIIALSAKLDALVKAEEERLSVELEKLLKFE